MATDLMMRMFLTILVAVFSVHASAFNSAERFEDLIALSRSKPENLTPSDTGNIAEFCRINGFRDDIFREASYGSDPTSILTETGYFQHEAWGTGFIASFDIRDALVMSHLFRIDNVPFKDSDYPAYRDTFQEDKRSNFYQKIEDRISRANESLDEKTKSLLLLGIDNMLASNADQKIFDTPFVGSMYICSDLSLFDSIGCASGVTSIKQMAKPVEDVTLLPVWREVFKDPAYMVAFKKVGLHILRSLITKNVTGTLFDDLYAAFFQFTKDRAKASEYTWQTIGVLATGGSNAYMRPSGILLQSKTAREFSQPLHDLEDLLFLLSAGTQALDRISMRDGYLYSYPQGINNICDYGKTYHFWMTAYLAHELSNKGIDTRKAAQAAYSVEKAYQFASSTAHREPVKPFTDPKFGNYSNNIRLDVTLASAGAWFGATYEQKRISITQDQFSFAFQQTFSHSQDPPKVKPLSFPDPTDLKSMVFFYHDWKKIINPDEAFRYFRNVSSQQ